MRLGASNYVSNLKWLSKSLASLIRKVENWQNVLLFYLSPRLSGRTLTIKLRNGMKLKVPSDHIFEPIAETLLHNAYGFDERHAGAVIVDVGASVGDFVLLASRTRGSRVYAFEPDLHSFRYMKENLSSATHDSVRIFNTRATAETLAWILDACGEPEIDFLKIDCEGCEYDLLLHCPVEVLSRVRMISMEIHCVEGHRKEEIVARLKATGFRVDQRRRLGEGHYVYGIRVT